MFQVDTQSIIRYADYVTSVNARNEFYFWSAIRGFVFDGIAHKIVENAVHHRTHGKNFRTRTEVRLYRNIKRLDVFFENLKHGFKFSSEMYLLADLKDIMTDVDDLPQIGNDVIESADRSFD